MLFTDFVLNGQGHGPLGQALGEMRFDPGLLRPYIDQRGVRCVTVNTGKTRYVDGLHVPVLKKVSCDNLRTRHGLWHPTWNASSMRKDAWILMDEAVQMAVRPRLRLWDDIAAASTYGGFDGMAKLTLEYEAMSDPGEAVVDMDAVAPGRTDSPLFKTRSMPLPITHSDFWFSQRRLAAARGSGQPLDTTMGEAAARRVGELVEKISIGVETGVTAGTDTNRHEGLSKIYGLTNFPWRITKSDLTVPLGTNPEAVLRDVLEMRQELQDANYYGPYILYHSPAYDLWMDEDYFRAGGTSATKTLRERLQSIGDIQEVRRLDYWTGATYQMVLVQMTSDVVRAVVGLPLTTIQWEERGGGVQMFKVMCIHVPQFRVSYNTDQAGIIHGTTA